MTAHNRRTRRGHHKDVIASIALGFSLVAPCYASPLLPTGVAQGQSKVDANIPLYYFTDAAQIVRILRPDASPLNQAQITALNDDLTTAKEAVASSERALLAAEGEVTDKKRARGEAIGNAELARQKASQAADATKRARDAKKLTAQKLADAQAALMAMPDDQALKTAEMKASMEDMAAGETLKMAEDSQKSAETELNGAKAGVDGAESDVAGALDKLKTAQTNLDNARKTRDTAQTNIDEALNNLRKAQAARDRTYVDVAAEPIAGETGDSLKMVYLRTAGSTEIFVRGAARDVAAVRRAIQQLDRPVSQARATLWTIQINATEQPRNSILGGSAPRSEVLEKAVNTVKADMALMQDQLAGSFALFRRCVEQEVARFESSTELDGKLIQDRFPGTDGKPAKLPNRYAFYEPSFLAGITAPIRDAPKDALFPNRLTWYADPMDLNSLGDVLIRVICARESSRRAILENYLRLVPNLAAGLELSSYQRANPKGQIDRKRKDLLKEYGLRMRKPRFLAALGYRAVYADDGKFLGLKHLADPFDPNESNRDYKVEPKDANVAAAQQAYILSMVNTIIRQLERAPYLAEMERYRADLDSSDAGLKGAAVPRFHEVLKTLASRSLIEDVPIPSLGVLQASNGPSVMDDLLRQVRAVNDQNLAVQTKGDQIVKQYVSAVEADLDEELIQPRLAALRAHAGGPSVDLAIVQETSVLAGDRRIARVDAKATLDLDFPPPVDALKEGIGLLKTIAKGSGGPAAASSALGGGSLESFMSKLVDLSNSATPGQPTTYTVTTGGTFELTPILLPNADNVAFQLDYQLMTPVREPESNNGRRIAHIDRHGLQTYVQDGSHEVRQLTSFQSQTDLQQPSTRTGGIPIIREFPLLRDIPLIGWFTKSGGRGRGVQESLIFIHTVQYPTVGALMDVVR